MSEVILYDYWRSSASYRVRIALNLLGIDYTARPVNLLTAEHKQADYLAINPQGILPALRIDGETLTQSLAIIEYLHATREQSTLLPSDLLGQHRVRQLSYAVAMEIHPICNLGVAQYYAEQSGQGDAGKVSWMKHFIAKGLAEFEALLAQGDAGAFCLGDAPTMADCCLIPQLYNADRWGVDYSAHKRIVRIAERTKMMDAFDRARPEAVKP